MGDCTTHRFISLQKAQKECVSLNKGDYRQISVCGDYISELLPPSPPENLSVNVVEVVPMSFNADFTWDESGGADGYNLYLSIDGGVFIKHNVALITDLFYTVEDLSTVDYQAYVTAVGNELESDPSSVVDIENPFTFFTDFSEYADNAFPVGWKDIWHDSPSFTWLVRTDHGAQWEGNAVLEHNQPSNEYDAVIWHELGQFTDFEILTFINPWVGGIFFAGMQGGIAFRCSDTDNSNKQGYTLGFRRRASAVDLITLQKWEGNVISSLAGSTAGGAVDPLEDIIYGVRILVEGERIRIRVWKQSDPEPAVWHIDVTDTGTVITTGYIGFTSSEGGSGTSGEWDADSIQIEAL